MHGSLNPPLKVVALGQFQVWLGSTPIPGSCLRQRRAGELLAMLLLAPKRWLTLDHVADALDPSRYGEASRVLVYHATSSLRRALEPDLSDRCPSHYLTVGEGTVSLHLPAGSEVDFEAFQDLCRQRQWEAAVQVYNGPLLPEFLYKDWTIAPRQRLVALYQDALLNGARQALASGRAQESLERCLQVLELEPAHEEATGLGMQACMALGDRIRALRLYRSLASVLKQEFDVQPQEALQVLYQALLAIGR